MALLGKTLNVFPKGFTWLLSSTLQVLGVAGSHIHALEVAHEVFLEIL
jgi:hypothetical protein